jgi:predicted phosphodiesterase
MNESISTAGGNCPAIDATPLSLPIAGRSSESALPMFASEPNARARLLVLSDLHLEFAPFVPPDPSCLDIAVLAGDIGQGTSAVRWMSEPSRFGGKPVVFVPGNHEFYGSERRSMLKNMRVAAAGTNFHVLDRDELILQGIRFLGTTLWTDFALDADAGADIAQAMQNGARGMVDFAGAIRERGGDDVTARFSPVEAAREHAISRAWLLDRLKAPLEESVCSTVVVTHHSPSVLSMAPMYQGSPLNPCFHSKLPQSFFQTADLWVHGHTHNSADYRHHRTRIVANPRGYPRHDGVFENEKFDPGLVIVPDAPSGAVEPQ